MSTQISILGCGWLGIPLAKALLQKGYKIKGSTTSSEKLEVLKSEGIQPFKIELKERKVIGDIASFLEGSEILIIDIPPGLRRNPTSDYIAKIKPLLQAISVSSLSKVLYISSTGIFEDHESIPGYTEYYLFSTSEIKANPLIEAEQLVLNLSMAKASVLRFGGLVGEGRHPIQFLAGRKGLQNPEAPVNLIHLSNCIRLILEVINQDEFGHIYHGVETIKLSKQAYYIKKAKDHDLVPPEFDHTQTNKGKTIRMDWTSKTLGIQLENKA
ncbi:short chain dehydrogenase/reductase, atypical SDR family [Psychroflexus torquis ATCC 700755]|uniref:Short chain dehydrogenase/reductase, atypical SDR family n=1 Tax=Psychroflexus torquis (strain ATCC 700755 / CIP 106069 / ACAM 623) TaxID=313595 RepID=K4ISF0_PSYTT|nr:short-chain dehydrogenase/reductase [Psychroflexus torquis]AFU68410.1 short chain dehydrogenase/reductase, atypical SDR family [Psychroflexus torquis ATCC 700755]